MIDGTRVLRLAAREGSLEYMLQQVFDAGYSQGFEYAQSNVGHVRERVLESEERQVVTHGEALIRELLTEPLRGAIRQAVENGTSEGPDSW